MRKPPREWNILEAIRQIIHRPHPNIRVPWGDDAFVFRNFPGYSVISQDMMVEDIHFDLAYTTASDLGYKSLAGNLSDVAAMGATPHFIHVSLAVPKKITESWLDEFYRSMTSLADKNSCQIVGGDLTSSPDKLVIDINIHSSCGGEPLTIQEGRPGDLVLSSGPLGLSKVGLWALQNHQMDFWECRDAHLRPCPRLDLVNELVSKRPYVKGLTDCSDGLLQDIYSFMNPKKTGFEIFADQLFLHPEVIKYSQQAGKNPVDIAISGGEDYELLVLIAPENLNHFTEWQMVGKLNSSREITVHEKGLKRILNSLEGWQHF